MNAPQNFSVTPPPSPRTAADLGLPGTMMRDIALKTMFRASLETVTEMATALHVPIPVAQELVDTARSLKFLEATGTQTADGAREMGYQLTDAGKTRAIEALAQSEYFGAMPVPLHEFGEQCKRQSIRNIQITRDRLMGAMGELIVTDALVDHLGPAVSAGRSILLYGPPGNGKSSLAAAICRAVGDRVYVPRAVEYAGQVITVYDPLVHDAAETVLDDPTSLRRTATGFDSRYVLCNRPIVITGGELELSMLDLVYNPTARTYQAPLQMKASGGIFVIDDLGRQKESPQTLINRWILPLEENRDILSLQSGEKFETPFDTLLIFSTNFHPNDMFDAAALRRIFYKILIDGPDQETYVKIFAAAARAKRMPIDEKAMIYLLKEKYPLIENEFANYQPKFLIDQMLSICAFEGTKPSMSIEKIDRAWENMFVSEKEFRH